MPGAGWGNKPRRPTAIWMPLSAKVRPGLWLRHSWRLTTKQKKVLGMATKAEVSLTSAVSALEREPGITQRAALLLRIAKRPGFSRDEKLEAAATRLASAADAKASTEKAETLARLAQFYAQSGNTDQYQALARRATEVTGLTALEKGKVGANVLVRGEMAAALGFHRAGAYQESESRIKKVASYLL